MFGTDINEEAANETRDLIIKEGGECVVHRCNMTVADEVRSAVDACVQLFGRIDILINNCGCSEGGGMGVMRDYRMLADATMRKSALIATCLTHSAIVTIRRSHQPL